MQAECNPNDLEHCCGDCLYEIAKAQRAKIERLQRVWKAAEMIVRQTTADAAYQLHDELIKALEAVEKP